MKFSPITHRKIGSIEILLFALVFEALRLHFFGVLGYLALLLVFFTGRFHFGGDFSLAQVSDLFRKQKEPVP